MNILFSPNNFRLGKSLQNNGPFGWLFYLDVCLIRPFSVAIIIGGSALHLDVYLRWSYFREAIANYTNLFLDVGLSFPKSVGSLIGGSAHPITSVYIKNSFSTCLHRFSSAWLYLKRFYTL